jgi:hypothetical protein
MKKHEEYARSRNPYYALVHAKSIRSYQISLFWLTFTIVSYTLSGVCRQGNGK